MTVQSVTRFDQALLDDLGLWSDDTHRAWDMLVDRRRGFLWRHLGTSERSMGEIIAALRTATAVPARTGHLADWGDIATGRSATLDHNLTICDTLRIGYPLLLDLGQTENATLTAGDTLFLPGSLLRGGRRTELPLFRFDGKRSFRRHDRGTPLFLPYVQTEHEGRRLSLVQLHRERIAGGRIFDASTVSQWLLRSESRVRQVLTAAVVAAGTDGQVLAEIFNRVAYSDGRVTPTPVIRTPAGYRCGDETFRSADALVDASLSPMRACGAAELAATMRLLPRCVPLMSVHMLIAVLALLGPERGPAQPAPAGTVDVHVHWGGIPMAGSPPRLRGYFATSASRTARFYEMAARRLRWAPPVAFVIAPVAPFVLWPSSSAPDDLPLVENLVSSAARTCAPGNRDDRVVDAVRRLVARWLERAGPRLSDGFHRQIRGTDRTSSAGELPPAVPVCPAGFEDLTMSQACLLAGSLIAAARGAV